MDNFLKEFNLLIKKIENEYQVNELLIDKIKIWPIIRFSLFEIVSRYKKQTFYERIYEKYLDVIIKNDQQSFVDEKLFEYDSFQDVIFISDDHFYVNKQNKFVNKYIDNIYKELQKDFQATKLHLDSKISQFKILSSKKIKPRESFKKIVFDEFTIKFIDDLRHEIKKSKFNMIDLEYFEIVLKNKMLDVEEGRNFIKDLSHKPKFIFYSSYTLPFKLGLNIESKNFGIKTIDVQHGKQGIYNPLYTNWNKVPVKNYEMLPDYFWTWNEISKKRIEQIDNSTSSGLKAVVSGYRFPANYEKNQKKENYVLVTLQPLVFQKTQFLQNFVVKCIKNNKNLKWIIKPHPKQNKRDIKKIKKELNFKNTIVTTEDNIFELFNKSCVHITEYSSTAFEALYFDVPTIFTSHIAKDEYSNEIDNGIFFYVDNYKSLNRKINSLMSGKYNFKNKEPEYIDYLKLEPINKNI